MSLYCATKSIALSSDKLTQLQDRIACDVVFATVFDGKHHRFCACAPSRACSDYPDETFEDNSLPGLVIGNRGPLVIDCVFSYPLIKKCRWLSETKIGAFAGVRMVGKRGNVVGSLSAIMYHRHKWRENQLATLLEGAATLADVPDHSQATPAKRRLLRLRRPIGAVH